MCPTSINDYVSLLSKGIDKKSNIKKDYALKRNIAYNLQYLEFIDSCLTKMQLTSVIKKQNIKTFIIVGCGILESFLHYLLIEKGLYKRTEWELEAVIGGNKKEIYNKTLKIENHIYRQLEQPKFVAMTFDSMLKSAEKKKIFGDLPNIYPRLKYLRQLRNKIHLQEIEHSTDTDYNSFDENDIKAMAQVLYVIFTREIFRASEKEKLYFSYLTEYFKD